MKQCTCCKDDKPLDQFSPDRRASDGRMGQCRACRRERSRQAYSKGKGQPGPAGVLICSRCKEPKDCSEFYEDPRRTTGRQSHCAECQKSRLRDSYRRNPVKYLLSAAKGRAKRAGLPFNLTEADIEIPERCPVLGIKLTQVRGRHRPSSPSLDQIAPGQGYVRGNVAVISWRANSLKRDASLSEMEKLVSWMRGVCDGGACEIDFSKPR